MSSTTVLTIPLENTDITIRCPYCDTESPVKDWNIDIELGSLINDDKLEIEYFIWNASCPICGDYIDVRNIERIPANDIIRLKEVIESYSVDVDEKKAKCPFCGKWNDFYDWDFKGIVKDLNIEILSRKEVSVDYSRPQEVLITTATCTECGCELRMDKMKVHVPISDDEIIMLINKIRETTSSK